MIKFLVKLLRNVFGTIVLLISASFALVAVAALFKIPEYRGWAVLAFGFNFSFAFLLFKIGNALTTFEVVLFKKKKR